MKGQRGFTLLEIIVAVSLLAMMAAVLFGSLALTSRTREGGEQAVEKTAAMRLAHEFLRAQLEAQHPLRMRKVAEFPLLFGGERDELRFAAVLPARVAGGGVWYYRLALDRSARRTPLVLERIVPDVNAAEEPQFRDADRSVLADDVADLAIGYLGRDPDSSDANAVSWRDHWDDKQKLPMLVRIDVRPAQGLPWPTLYVAPRHGPEAGCRAWDNAQQRCFSV